MNRFILVSSLLAVVAITACSTVPKRPEIKAAGIAPSELKPGDSAVIAVEIADKFGVVDRVEGTLKEDPSVSFRLFDDGVLPDKKAGDGIWSRQMDVPFNAPPGSFEVTIKAYNASGAPILIVNESGEVEAMTAVFGLLIRFPPEQ